MTGGLLRRQALFVDQLLQQRMVAAELVQTRTTPQVAAAVAGPDAGGAVTLDQQGDHGAADHRVGACGGDRQLLTQAAVKDVQALAQLIQALLQVACAGLGQLLDDQAAGQGAVLVPAHAIGHHPQALLGQGQEGVLVARAYLAGVGARGAAPVAYGQFAHHSLAGSSKLRSRPRSKGFGERWLCSR